MNTIKTIFAILIAPVILGACGGGGGGSNSSDGGNGSSNPAYATVSGLASGATLTLLINGTPETVTADGKINLPVSTSATVTVGVQPFLQNCVVTNASTSIAVTCGSATESVVYSFNNKNAAAIRPSTFMLAKDGNYYGISQLGGTLGGGAFFKLTPNNVMTVLYSFEPPIAQNVSAQFPVPTDPLIQGSDGNFYAVTRTGGNTSGGAVIQLTAAGVQNVIFNFENNGGASTTGYSPIGALVQGSDGYFYGVTTQGGANNCGTIYKVTTAGQVTVLYSFLAPAPRNPAEPIGSLVFGTDGNLYGVTMIGGTYEGGTAFKISPNGTYTELYAFGGPGSISLVLPQTGLTLGSDGNFYGVASKGGPISYGGVFKITPSGTITELYGFGTDNVNDLNAPQQAMVLASDGNFYGVASMGGTNDFGGVFKVTPSGNFSPVVSFSSNAEKSGSLIIGSDGNLHGVAALAGASGFGVAYTVTLSGSYSTFYDFSALADGISPASLLQAKDGNIYGTTTAGGAYGSGTVFKFASDGSYSVLWSFGRPGDGTKPQGHLIQGADGYLYGTTVSGGVNGTGAVFKLSTAGVESILYSFAATGSGDGASPNGIIQSATGAFYGTTLRGGANDVGTLFALSQSGNETVLHVFDNTGADGASPTGRLVEAPDGNLYGTTLLGGFGNGTVFKVTPGGALTVLYHFQTNFTDGINPIGAFLLASDGNFYGTTQSGLNAACGVVFKISPSGTESVLYDFPGPCSPYITMFDMVQATDGNLYITTADQGKNNAGSLIRLTLSGTATIMNNFGAGQDGRTPLGLIQTTDGSFYGVLNSGGTAGYGALFRY